jgi:hypothetical protein
VKYAVILSAALILVLAGSCWLTTPPAQAITLSPDEQELYDLIMDYRTAESLDTIPFSPSLTLVAQTHAEDLAL